jgi:hypothetical protein
MRKLITLLSISAGLLCLSASSAFAHQITHHARAAKCKVGHHRKTARSCHAPRRTIHHRGLVAAAKVPSKGKASVKAPAVGATSPRPTKSPARVAPVVATVPAVPAAPVARIAPVAASVPAQPAAPTAPPATIAPAVPAVPAPTSSPSPSVKCDLYASPSGSGNGSLAAPFGTVQQLETSLSPGQTGCLNAGTYGGLTTYNNLTKAGTSGNPITLTATPGDATVPTVDGYTVLDANYITLTGLALNGSNTFYAASNYGVNGNASCAADGPGSNGLEVEGANDTLIHNNIYQVNNPPVDQSGNGIGVDFNHGTGGGDNTVIAYNKIHNIGNCDAYDHLIYLAGGNNVQIHDNWMWSNSHGYGISIYPDPQNAQIYSNVIDAAGVGFGFGSSFNGTTVTHNIVTNSVGLNDIDTGFTSLGGFANCLSSSTVSVTNNDSYNNPGGVQGAGCPNGATFGTTMTENPSYTSQSTHNYTVTDPNMASWGLWDGTGTP